MIQRMKDFFDRLKALYPDIMDHEHARSLAMLSIVLVVMVLAFLLLEITTGVLSATFASNGGILILTILVLTAVGAGLDVYLVNLGNLRAARLVFTGILFMIGTGGMGLRGLTYVGSAYILVPIIASGLLFGTRGAIAGMMVSGVLLWLVGLADGNGAIYHEPYSPASLNFAAVAITLSALTAGLLLTRFAGTAQRALTQARRTGSQLRTITDVTQTMAEAAKLDVLLPRVVELVRERLGYYHVQIFLIDERTRDAVLSASTGIAGQQMLARSHRLPVGSRSVIGQVTQHGEIVYATDTSQDPVHRRNEFLPATRSELALPLRDGITIIGALDVQSIHPNAFPPDDIEILQVLANQIATMIRSARLLERAEVGLEENRRLYDESQANLVEIERLNRQLTGQAWQAYFTGRGAEAPGVAVEGPDLRHSAEWTPALVDATQERQAIVREEGLATIMAVPIELRGTAIGALEVSLPPGPYQADALEMANAVARRLALSLDNARLFEEAQSQAQREQLINSIGGQLQSVNEVDDMLRVTLVQLQRALGASRASIRLRPIQATQDADEPPPAPEPQPAPELDEEQEEEPV